MKYSLSLFQFLSISFREVWHSMIDFNSYPRIALLTTFLLEMHGILGQISIGDLIDHLLTVKLLIDLLLNNNGCTGRLFR